MMCSCDICINKSQTNKRTRSSVLISIDTEHILIDLSPDFKLQFLSYIKDIIPKTVLITHAHNDHISGIGDYADLCYWNKIQSSIYSPLEA
jgi:phosphoribosyl 1,2-cyclic phosphate phosphodiesterase